MEPKGIRLNNPGNIRKSADKWQGLSEEQPDPYFLSFDEPVFGIRAIVKTIWTYQDKYSLDTVSKLIRRWAPPLENNTSSYVDAVAKEIGVQEDCRLDLKRPSLCASFVKAIIHHENGKQPYPDELINKAITLAEVQ